MSLDRTQQQARGRPSRFSLRVEQQVESCRLSLCSVHFRAESPVREGESVAAVAAESILLVAAAVSQQHRPLPHIPLVLFACLALLAHSPSNGCGLLCPRGLHLDSGRFIISTTPLPPFIAAWSGSIRRLFPLNGATLVLDPRPSTGGLPELPPSASHRNPTERPLHRSVDRDLVADRS